MSDTKARSATAVAAPAALNASEASLTSRSLPPGLLEGITVQIDVKLGDLSLTLADLFNLSPGAVLTINKQLNELVELKLNGSAVATGEIVAVGDHFGVRIVDTAGKG